MVHEIRGVIAHGAVEDAEKLNVVTAEGARDDRTPVLQAGRGTGAAAGSDGGPPSRPARGAVLAAVGTRYARRTSCFFLRPILVVAAM